MAQITKAEFEKLWAAGQGMKVSELTAARIHAEPCDCGDPSCQGWQMVRDAMVELNRKLDKQVGIT